MSERMEEVVNRKAEHPDAKRRARMLPEGDRVNVEGSSGKVMEAPAPKARKKRAAADAGETEAKRRRKPKTTVEVNSTFTELRRLLQDMRPSTLQVLRTPYFRNCKAARNMRKGVRQIRDFCKQVRMETVNLAKKKQGEESGKKKKKPEAGPTPDRVGAKAQDSEAHTTSHSLDQIALSNEKKPASREVREASVSSEGTKPRLLAPKLESSPAPRDREREVTPKRERENDITPRRDRDKSPKREEERESYRDVRDMETDTELLPKGGGRDSSPAQVQTGVRGEEEVEEDEEDEGDEELSKFDSEESV